jgi:hypothetical protein
MKKWIAAIVLVVVSNICLAFSAAGHAGGGHSVSTAHSVAVETAVRAATTGHVTTHSASDAQASEGSEESPAVAIGISILATFVIIGLMVVAILS